MTTHNKRGARKRKIDSYSHKDKERANNPPVGLVDPKTDPYRGEKETYQYAPYTDPQLQWAGKAERTSFGPEHAPMEQRQVENALQEAGNLRPKPKIIIFAAFQFDPEAAKDIDETNWPGMTLLKAQMNADMQTADLEKNRSSNESFWLIGQPVVTVEQTRKGAYIGQWIV